MENPFAHCTPGQDTRAKQQLKTMNAARSLYEISAHSSMYIPISIPSSGQRLPAYVQLDRDSMWHTSALLSTAVESMTLPSRLRPGGQGGFLNDIEAVLNVNGNQQIACLQMTVVGGEPLGQRRGAKESANDARMRRRNSDSEKSVADNVRLDMDFLPSGSEVRASNRRDDEKKEHVFGQVESLRGLDLDEAGQELDGYARKRRRLAALPTVEKSVSNVLFCVIGHVHIGAGTNYDWTGYAKAERL